MTIGDDTKDSENDNSSSCLFNTYNFFKIIKEALITWRELLRQENYKWIKEIVERSKIIGYWREETGKNNFFEDESKQVARISTKTTLMKWETVELTKNWLKRHRNKWKTK